MPVLHYINPKITKSPPPPRAWDALGIGMAAIILSGTVTLMGSIGEGRGQTYGLLCALAWLFMLAVAVVGIVIAVRSSVEGPMRGLAGAALWLNISAVLFP